MSDGRIDQFVKARWLAFGISQSDLAEVLAFRDTYCERDRRESSRLKQIAEALEVPDDFLSGPASMSGAADSPVLQSLLDLRLLRAFRELHDTSAKRMLIQLVEQIVKCQAPPPGDAS